MTTENEVKVRPTLTNMEVGDKVIFSITKTKGVRAQASDLGLILERKYRTTTDRANRIIIVTRVS